MGEGARLVLLGLIGGLLAALAATRVLTGFLFGVEPVDAAVYVGVGLFLSAVALAATWVPAHRATRVDPITALRQE
jgi:ABC-type antimicrobial peptide transport system permease subunit